MRRHLTCIVLAVIAGSSEERAQAATDACSATVLSARGEPASYRWLALVKARGNWRTKIRGMQELGATYAEWTAAADQVERCIENAGSVVCTVSGRPCRR